MSLNPLYDLHRPFRKARPLSIRIGHRNKPGEKKEFHYQPFGRLKIFEGDIKLGPSVGLNIGAIALGKQIGLTFSKRRFRWPGKIVPYVIDDNFLTRHERMIEAAIKKWGNATSLRFLPMIPGDRGYPDYIYFKKSSYRCSSNIGRQGGRQIIEIVGGIPEPLIIHEIGHAIGLWHEHSRYDRDIYIKINRKNIKSGHEHNFRQLRIWDRDVGKYDYDSIMHYNQYAFSKSKPRLKTIEVNHNYPRNQNKIGNARLMSKSDIDAVESIYR